MIKNLQVTVIVAILAILTSSAAATVYTQLAFAANASGVNGGTPCAQSNASQHNPVTMPNITIFVCDDKY